MFWLRKLGKGNEIFYQKIYCSHKKLAILFSRNSCRPDVSCSAVQTEFGNSLKSFGMSVTEASMDGLRNCYNLKDNDIPFANDFSLNLHRILIQGDSHAKGLISILSYKFTSYDVLRTAKQSTLSEIVLKDVHLLTKDFNKNNFLTVPAGGK